MVGRNGEYCEVNVIVIVTVRMICKENFRMNVCINPGQRSKISMKAEQHSLQLLY